MVGGEEGSVYSAYMLAGLDGTIVSGASLGYRINGGRWQVYSGAFGAAPDDYVEARAVRYGWRESEATKFEVPR